MVCKSCGAELKENANFCVKCGAKIEREVYCNQCGTKLEMGDVFCYNCGAKVNEHKDAVKTESPDSVETTYYSYSDYGITNRTMYGYGGSTEKFIRREYKGYIYYLTNLSVISGRLDDFDKIVYAKQKVGSQKIDILCQSKYHKDEYFVRDEFSIYNDVIYSFYCEYYGDESWYCVGIDINTGEEVSKEFIKVGGEIAGEPIKNSKGEIFYMNGGREISKASEIILPYCFDAYNEKYGYVIMDDDKEIKKIELDTMTEIECKEMTQFMSGFSCGEEIFALDAEKEVVYVQDGDKYWTFDINTYEVKERNLPKVVIDGKNRKCGCLTRFDYGRGDTLCFNGNYFIYIVPPNFPTEDNEFGFIYYDFDGNEIGSNFIKKPETYLEHQPTTYIGKGISIIGTLIKDAVLNKSVVCGDSKNARTFTAGCYVEDNVLKVIPDMLSFMF